MKDGKVDYRRQMGVGASYSVRDQGKDYELSGIHRAAGDDAPSFTVMRTDGRTTWAPLEPCDCTTVLLSVPSLDTPVCDEEAKTFSKRAGEMPGTRVVVVSMDLPYAQGRWLRDNGISNVLVGSDHMEGDFAYAYGVLISALQIATRAVFVVSAARKVLYAAYMPELNQQVDFEEIIAAAKA